MAGDDIGNYYCCMVAKKKCYEAFPNMGSNSDWEPPEEPDNLPPPSGLKWLDMFPADAEDITEEEFDAD